MHINGQFICTFLSMSNEWKAINQLHYYTGYVSAMMFCAFLLRNYQ